MVFLVLAAQYESWSVPFAVILAVPFGMFGALLAVWLRGMTNDIYFQIGLVTLIGLSAKNAILIVEFANQRFARMNRWPMRRWMRQTAFPPDHYDIDGLHSGRVSVGDRSGAGAASRNSIGTGVFGGMLAATFLAIFFVPLFFVLIGKITQRKTPQVIAVNPHENAVNHPENPEDTGQGK